MTTIVEIVDNLLLIQSLRSLQGSLEDLTTSHDSCKDR